MQNNIKIGDKIFMLTILSGPINIRKKYERKSVLVSSYMVKCDCGVIKYVPKGRIVGGYTKSCGCYKKNILGNSRRKHGKRETKEYKIWTSMKNRCYNKNEKCYYRYGGAGVIVCDRWKNSFENFLEDMGVAPSDKHSIDRINNLLGYEPSNCRWSDSYQQANNKSNNIKIEINGVVKNMTEWCREYQVSNKTVSARIKNGWDKKEAILKPVRKFNYK